MSMRQGTTMRIDSHQHYWAIARGDYSWLTPALAPIYRDFLPADLAPLIAAAGIDRTIAVQAAPTEAETLYLLELAETAPSIAGVVGWSDFMAEDAPARIARLAENRLLVGLRPMMQDIADADWMLRPPVAAALTAMQAHGLVFDALVRPHQLSRLIVLADRHPELSIVLDHCAKPAIAAGTRQPWAADIAALAERRNVRVKLSGLVTEAGPDWTIEQLRPYVVHTLSAFGPERVLWGSDWPVLNRFADYARWIAASRDFIAHFSADDRAAIEGGNAAATYLATRGRPC